MIVTIPDGQLPIAPTITPGWGVAGAVMLVTGLVYTLVGIKNRWIHTFFSTAYVASLGIAVLIVYVMNVPVSNALQGGYVAAIILSGCALGAASVFFKELTEGLGCALGGFCVSMWLLCLTPGGLLKPVASKAIFIACFTLVSFAFYFSRYTRDWALITMISFAGATVVVLGIDCFSKAGLKEFWAYIWDLNENLFPLGADTYPVTKGIRVETAAIVIIFLAGIISQIKLWRIVRDKRQKRAAERAEGQRNLEQEEADVGRQIEETTARERRAWERIYGDGETGDSTLSDNVSEKKLRQSYNGSSKPRSEVEVYELADISESDRGQTLTDPMEKDQDGRVVVKVAADDVPEAYTETDAGLDEKRRNASSSTHRSSKISTEKKRQSTRSVPEAPEVVPLPFTVPTMQDEDARSEADRSSVATFAGDDDQDQAYTPRRGHSLAKRLSKGSTTLLRSLSQRSARTKRASNLDAGESSEDLVVPHVQRDDESSVAATFDGQSEHGSVRHSILGTEQSPDVEVNLQISDKEFRKSEMEIPTRETSESKQRHSQLDSSTTSAASEGQKAPESPPETGNDKIADDLHAGVEESQQAQSVKAKSSASVNSKSASLTKERLPDSLSKVALSYRTNEWAKHLSYADAPELDELNVEAAKPAKRDSLKERPAPVNVEELRQGADEGVPGSNMVRSDSRLSNASLHLEVSKRQSRQNVPPSSVSSPDREQSFSPPLSTANPSMMRSASSVRRTSATFQPIAEEHDGVPYPASMHGEQDRRRSTSPAPSAVSALGQRQPVAGLVSYSSPQTLLGQREMYLRNRSSGNLLSDLPEERPSTALPAGSDAGSLYNYPVYAAALAVDPDDIPLSQRKELMRHNSLVSLQGNPPLHRASSGMDLSAERRPFDSHQPKRISTLPTSAAREAQLANFRNSVAADLRAGSPMITSQSRATPFASTNNLLSTGRESEIRRNIDLQRNKLIGQKEAEAQQREMDRQQKEWTDRAFDERMRNGELLDAHREAMRKMQRGAKGH